MVDRCSLSTETDRDQLAKCYRRSSHSPQIGAETPLLPISDSGLLIGGDASATSTAAVTVGTTAADVTVERDATPPSERAQERRERRDGDWSPLPPPDAGPGDGADEVLAVDENTRLICDERKFDRNDDNDNPLVTRGELELFLSKQI